MAGVMAAAAPVLLAVGGVAADVMSGGSLTPALVAGAAAAAGSGEAAVGAISSGMTQNAVYSHNAKVASANAENAMTAAQSTAGMLGQQTARQQGAIRSAFGAAGVEGSGSPLTVMSDQAAQGELAQQLALYKGRTQQQADIQQSSMLKIAGQSALTGSAFQAGGSLLSGAARSYGTLYPGMPPPGSSGTSLIRLNGMAALA